MAEGENPFLIVPPPGLLPPARTQPGDDAPPAGQETVGGDSATRRISPPREPVIIRPPAGGGIPFVTPTATPAVTPPAAPVSAAPVTAVPLSGAPVSAAAPAAAPPAAAPASATPSVVDDDETRIVEPRASRVPVWRLVLPDGSAVTVQGAVFVGRNPTRTTGDVEGQLLAVDDTTKSVSKTHALIEVLDGGLWVTDLNSTNGVFVTSEFTDDVQPVPGERTPVPAGCDIELGEFVIQVEQA